MLSPHLTIRENVAFVIKSMAGSLAAFAALELLLHVMACIHFGWPLFGGLS